MILNIRRFKRSRGFSLVELMISLVIGLLLTAAVLQTFLSMKRTYSFTEDFSRVQENGRFAMEFLTRDTRGGGNFGCLTADFDASSAKFENDLNTPTDVAWDLSNPIDGHDNIDGSFSDYPNVVLGTDVVVLKMLESSAYPLVSPYNSGAQMFVDRDINAECADGDPDCLIGEILIVTDCSQGTIFQATNATDQLAQDRVNIVHSGASVTPGNADPTFDNEYGDGAFIAKFKSVAYYIRNNTAGVPSLYRSRLSLNDTTDTEALTEEELVEGIEDMQILYGEDTNADSVADYYVPADHVVDMGNVVSIQLSLLVTSIADNLTEVAGSTALPGSGLTPQIDRKIRKVFNTKVAIRNRLN